MGTIVRCMGTIVRCMGTIVRCMGTIVRCMGTIVRCMGTIVPNPITVYKDTRGMTNHKTVHLCSDYTLHSAAGEVAAYKRRSVGQPSTTLESYH